MIKQQNSISLGTAALVAGLPLFIPTAPYAEFYVFGKLIISNNAVQTTQNLLEHSKLFISGIFAILFTYVYDIVLAWAFYIFLRPVNSWISLLCAWFRIVYTVLAIVALYNYIYAYQLLNTPDFQADIQAEQIFQLVNARKFGMHLAYIIFGIYLILSGILIYKAHYIPKLLGILIVLAGLSWIILSLKPYFFNSYNLSWLIYFSIGELILGIWLLAKGRLVKESAILN